MKWKLNVYWVKTKWFLMAEGWLFVVEESKGCDVGESTWSGKIESSSGKAMIGGCWMKVY